MADRKRRILIADDDPDLLELLKMDLSFQEYDVLTAVNGKEALEVATKEEALDDADCLVICTEWKAFRAPDFEDIKVRLTSPVIIDGRNLYNPQHMEAAGIEYFGIGRGRSVNRA